MMTSQVRTLAPQTAPWNDASDNRSKTSLATKASDIAAAPANLCGATCFPVELDDEVVQDVSTSSLPRLPSCIPRIRPISSPFRPIGNETASTHGRSVAYSFTIKSNDEESKTNNGAVYWCLLTESSSTGQIPYLPEVDNCFDEEQNAQHQQHRTILPMRRSTWMEPAQLRWH